MKFRKITHIVLLRQSYLKNYKSDIHKTIYQMKAYKIWILNKEYLN